MNFSEIGNVFALIIDNAFNGDALKGGIVGVLITGFQRAAFSNEAGIGSASIAHSAVKTSYPASEGIVALLEPFIDTVVICTLTALVIIFFNVGPGGNLEAVFQYGVEAFCKRCQEIGIDGLILPDLPLDVYQKDYESIFKKYGLANVFLITPQTSDARINEIDQASDGFIYMVSSASTTGATKGFGSAQKNYFDRIAALKLHNPQIVGFGINNAETFQQATQSAAGAIIGSAFIKHLTKNGVDSISEFINTIR